MKWIVPSRVTHTTALSRFLMFKSYDSMEYAQTIPFMTTAETS